MLAAGVVLALVAVGQAPTLDGWIEALGPPTKSVELSERVRSADEPRLTYWMRTRAAPLGVGPALAGTLVANFAGDAEGALLDFTFLAVAQPSEVAALLRAVRERGWVAGEQVAERAGGRFSDVRLALPDGRRGTLAIRQAGGTAAGRAVAIADGRPSPSLWLHVHR